MKMASHSRVASAEICREANPAVAVLAEKLGEVVFVDEGVAPLKRGDLTLVIIDADDRVTHLCETNGGDKADVSGAYNSDWNWFAHSE